MVFQALLGKPAVAPDRACFLTIKAGQTSRSGPRLTTAETNTARFDLMLSGGSLTYWCVYPYLSGVSGPTHSATLLMAHAMSGRIPGSRRGCDYLSGAVDGSPSGSSNNPPSMADAGY